MLSRHIFLPERRLFLATGALGLASSFYTVKGAFAEELTKTPDQTKGPFYPTKLPLDTDNDLILINDEITPAVGEITHVTGKVLDNKGNPIKNAVVEIWQVDSKAAYLHPRSDNYKNRDTNFQGFGRFVTSSTGEYYFRTIKPVAYPGRTPHIHFLVKKGGKELLATQLYIKGEKRNEKDGIWKSIRNAKARDNVTVEFAKVKGSKTGELAAKFDSVLGRTPAE